MVLLLWVVGDRMYVFLCGGLSSLAVRWGGEVGYTSRHHFCEPGCHPHRWAGEGCPLSRLALSFSLRLHLVSELMLRRFALLFTLGRFPFQS